jgi:hypothetical protein
MKNLWLYMGRVLVGSVMFILAILSSIVNFVLKFLNNISKQPNVHVLEKFEIITLFYIQVCIK